jgi:predicted amidohydrolase
MENTVVACIQPRMSITTDREGFVAEARRFLRQAQARSAQLAIFPELMGLMLAPPLISRFKLGFIRRADQGKQPTAGFLRRRMGGISGVAAGAMGGGFRGSLKRLLQRRSDALHDLYCETFGDLAREYGMVIVGGSLYFFDDETATIRNRAFVFDTDGVVLGFQDKFNLTADEQDLASPGSDMSAIQTPLGKLGLLIGRDALYPELARALAVQGVDLMVGIAASPGTAQAAIVRSALALRAEENQAFATASFMLGPNHLDRASPEEYYGRSAVFAPISLTVGGSGILAQTGTDRAEGLITADLDTGGLLALRETSRFRPRQEMNLGNLGPVLAEMYQDGLSIEQAINRRIAQPFELPVILLEDEPEAIAEYAADTPVDEPEATAEFAADTPVDEPEATTEDTADTPVDDPDATAEDTADTPEIEDLPPLEPEMPAQSTEEGTEDEP